MRETYSFADALSTLLRLLRLLRLLSALAAASGLRNRLLAFLLGEFFLSVIVTISVYDEAYVEGNEHEIEIRRRRVTSVDRW